MGRNDRLAKGGYNFAEPGANKILPSTFVHLVEAKRVARSSDFDRGYEEFLRNYSDDLSGRGGNYQIGDSFEHASYTNDGYEDDESDDDESDDDEEESDGDGDGDVEVKAKKPKAGFNTEKATKSFKKSEHSKKSSKKNPQRPKNQNPFYGYNGNPRKQCKLEKRDGKICYVCYNSINDMKSESCQYSSEPKEGNRMFY